MRRQHINALALVIGTVFTVFACASEEGGTFSNKGAGGSGAKGGTAGGAGSSFAGTSSVAGKGGVGGSGGATGGTGGTGGTAGATGGTAGTNTAGMGGTPADDEDACSVGGAGFGDGVLRADFQSASSSATQNPGGSVNVVNDTGAAQAEATFTVRYYFTSEFGCDEAGGHSATVSDFRLQNPHVGLSSSDVTVSTVVVGDNATAGCDVYFEFAFTTALESGQYAALSFFSAPPSYSGPATDQTNDPSFSACTKEPVPWSPIAVLVDDVLSWGNAPGDGGGGGAGGAGGAAGVAGAGSVAGAGGA